MVGLCTLWNELLQRVEGKVGSRVVMLMGIPIESLVGTQLNPCNFTTPSSPSFSSELVCFVLFCWPCLPRQGYIVFRFIIEYSSLRDFGP
jgi:hypothetical protein